MESLRNSGDYNDLLCAFNAEAVRYLIVGGFALAAYGRPRYTKDLDIWVDPEGDNPERVVALSRLPVPHSKASAPRIFEMQSVFFKSASSGCAPIS